MLELLQIQKQLDWLPFRKSEDAAAFLVTAIKRDYGPPPEIKRLIEQEQARTEELDRLKRIKEVVDKAKQASSIIFPSGLQFFISQVRNDGWIEIYRDGRSSMIHPDTVLASQFV